MRVQWGYSEGTVRVHWGYSGGTVRLQWGYSEGSVGVQRGYSEGTMYPLLLSPKPLTLSCGWLSNFVRDPNFHR